MKKLILLLVVLVAVSAAQAIPTLSFSPFSDGGATYEDGVITFVQPIIVTNYTTDPYGLVPTFKVELPQLEVTPNGSNYIATPVAPSLVSLTDLSGAILFSGELGIGDIKTTNTTAGAYTVYKVDIEWDMNTVAGAALTDPELIDFLKSEVAGLALSFEMETSNTFNEMFAGDLEEPVDFNFSGTLSANVVPVPGAFLLGGLGVACVGWIKRRKSL